MTPGQIALIRNPALRYSFAAVFVSPSTPCLAEQYGDRYGTGTSPAADAMFTIVPAWFGSIARISCFSDRNVPVRSTPTTRFHSSSAISAIFAPDPAIPAQFTAASSRPNSASAAATAASTSGSTVTSARTNNAVPPALRTSSTVSGPEYSPASVRSTTTTAAAPSPANSSAGARPIPPPPPPTPPTLPAPEIPDP